jgi:hypothetical protein
LTALTESLRQINIENIRNKAVSMRSGLINSYPKGAANESRFICKPA